MFGVTFVLIYGDLYRIGVNGDLVLLVEDTSLVPPPYNLIALTELVDSGLTVIIERFCMSSNICLFNAEASILFE